MTSLHIDIGGPQTTVAQTGKRISVDVGEAGESGSSFGLDQLSDVDLTRRPLTSEHWLGYSASRGQWENQNISLNSLDDVTTEGATQTGQLLSWSEERKTWERGNVPIARVLDDLEDVDLSRRPVTSEDWLGYSAKDGTWQQQNIKVNSLSDADTETVRPANGDALTWNSGAQRWEPYRVPRKTQDLTDVYVEVPRDRQTLIWKSTFGAYRPDWLELTDLKDVSTSVVQPSAGDTLVYNSQLRQWVPGTSVTQGITPLQAVAASTTQEIDLAAPPAEADGWVLADGDRLLVRFQSDPAQNGIYDYAAGGLARSADADDEDDLINGNTVFVQNGDQWGGVTFMCALISAELPWTPDVDSNLWWAMSAPMDVQAGDGLRLDANTLHVQPGPGILINANNEVETEQEVFVADAEPAPGLAALWVDTEQLNGAQAGAYLPLAGGQMTGGIGFGDVAAPSPADLTRHLDLYGGTFGINITSGRINVVAPGSSRVTLASGAQPQVSAADGSAARDILDVNTGTRKHHFSKSVSLVAGHWYRIATMGKDDATVFDFYATGVKGGHLISGTCSMRQDNYGYVGVALASNATVESGKIFDMLGGTWGDIVVRCVYSTTLNCGVRAYSLWSDTSKAGGFEDLGTSLNTYNEVAL